MRARHTRKEIFFNSEEMMLIKFAMKCTGLDMTATIRLMMRQGIIEEIIKYCRTGKPKMPPEIVAFIEKF